MFCFESLISYTLNQMVKLLSDCKEVGGALCPVQTDKEREYGCGEVLHHALTIVFNLFSINILSAP